VEPEYSKQAEKFLDRQNDKTYNRIKAAVNDLPDGDVKKVQGHKDLYRLRVGGFRIVFAMVNNNIFVKTIDNRGQIYRHL